MISSVLTFLSILFDVLASIDVSSVELKNHREITVMQSDINAKIQQWMIYQIYNVFRSTICSEYLLMLKSEGHINGI